MTDKENTSKKGGRIKDRISGSGNVKKKIVIKKKTEPQSKNITDHFSKEKAAKTPVRREPVVRKKVPVVVKRTPGRPAEGRGPGTQAPREAGKKPTEARDRRAAPEEKAPAVEPTERGTPFDEVIEAGKKQAAAGGGGRKHHYRKSVMPGGGDRGRKGTYEKDRANRFYAQPERKRKQPAARGTTVPSHIEIMESIQVGELAKKLNLRPSDLISKFMKLGEMVTINKIIDAEKATMVAGEYGCEVRVVSLFDETVIEEDADRDEERITRPPVVTIMGHVDHGKTRLLDTIRKSNIIDTESGAITQHIGAYQVEIPRGKITFLDTPGHEAFTAMRARGAAVTDIVVLVVAADDGVKQQTLEALSHAKAANVPIIVAVNKVDLEAANPERVRQELSQHGLQPEEWGGSAIFCDISAKQNIGIDNLLEMILLQAEMLELKANHKVKAVGTVIEARIDPGKGPVATILVQKGTLYEGDPFVVGVFSGRIRTMCNDRDQRVMEAGPSTPVEITGLDGVPQAGDPFHKVDSEKYGREVATKRQHYQQISTAADRAQPTLGDLKSWMEDQEMQELHVIIKADVQGSVEAIRDGILKLSTDEVKVKVIHGAAGAISEWDVDLAKASDAIILGFQVKPTPRAHELAGQHRVTIKFYTIIYDIINDVRNFMEGMLEPEIVEEVIGRVEVREVFKISKIGNVAGCMVLSGKIRRNSGVRLIRDGVVVFSGDLKSLKRHKDDTNEVSEGFECGIALDGYNDIRVGDQLESYQIEKIARKLTAQ